MQKIVPHLWFDTQAVEAAEFYTKVFPRSEITMKTQIHNTPSGDCDIVSFSLRGFEFQAISAGPYFKITPAISFLVVCQSAEEVDELWEKLIDGGQALMEINSYPFSKRYGWVMDKYGVTWQLIWIEEEHLEGRNILPCIMFVGENYGKAEEAMEYYTSLFENAKMGPISRYGEGKSPDKAEAIEHGEFTLSGQWFSILESAYDHKFSLNEAISFIYKCEDQAEIDQYWEELSAVPEAEQCGWIKDKYGLSWQITPKNMEELTSTDEAVQAMLTMKKIEIEPLKKLSAE